MTQRETLVEAVLHQTGPFCMRDIMRAANETRPGTVSAVLGALVRGRILDREPMNGNGTVGPGHGYRYSVVQHVTTEQALVRLRRAVVRPTRAKGRRKARSTPPPFPSSSLAVPLRDFTSSLVPARVAPLHTLGAVRDALDKAARYEALLAYLGLTDADVRAELSRA